MSRSRPFFTMTWLFVVVACGEPEPPPWGREVANTRFEVVEASHSPWEIGESIRLSDLAGKPVILDFWASWCGPCVAQHQYVTELKEEYGDRIEVLGVSFEDRPEDAREWLRRHGSAYPTVRELNGTLEKQLWIRSVPYFVLLTPDRRLSWAMIGPGWGVDSVSTRLREMVTNEGSEP